MKKPLLPNGKLFLFILFLSLVGLVTTYYLINKHHATETEGEEEGEGTPGIIPAMDMWSNMRTYPFKTMPAEHLSEAYAQTRNMDFSVKARTMHNARGENVQTPH